MTFRTFPALDAIPFHLQTGNGYACAHYSERPEHPADPRMVDTGKRPYAYIPPALRAQHDREARAVCEYLRESIPAPVAVDVDAIDRATFLAMPSNVYAKVHALCVRSARRGRYLGHAVARDVADPLPMPTSVEDDEAATDAIGTTFAILQGRAHPAPVRLARSIAKRFAARRAQHRLRVRDGLTERADVGHAMMHADTIATLLAGAAGAVRRAAERAIAEGASVDTVVAKVAAVAGRAAYGEATGASAQRRARRHAEKARGHSGAPA